MRDCKNCKHLIMYDYKNKSYSCEKWECKFEPKEQEPTTKNDLGVDCISRAEMLRYQEYLHGKMPNEENYKLWKFIKALPSVTTQEPTDKNFTKADINAIVKAINAHWELIIDEIRAEIEELDYITFDGITKKRCLEIIEKYKAENNS